MKEIIEELKLTVESTFVPFSQSRNRNDHTPNLNWRVRLLHHGHLVLETDYGAGCGHAPSYKERMTVDGETNLRFECETGQYKGKPILPDTVDVIYSLVSDADVLNYDSFEEWAPEFGYDVDSRKAEVIYRACLDLALRLRNRLGEAALAHLQEAANDY